MNAVLRKIASKIKRLLKRQAKTLYKAPKEIDSRLIFVFGGRTQYWEGMGISLFNEEPIFRSSIETYDKITHEICGISILSAFKSGADNQLFGDDEGKIILSIAAIQLALFELLKSKDIAPSSIMGISAGESAAVYAAGGLTIEDALRVSACLVLVTQHDKKEYITLFLFTNMKNAAELCKSCPEWVAPIYDAGPDNVLLYCKPTDVQAIINYFKSKDISCKKIYNELYWPFHTSRIHDHKNLIRQYIKSISPKPLQLDYYSPTLGSIIPKNTIIPVDYWYDLMCKPVLIHETVNLIRNVENLVMVHLGPYFFLKTHIQNALSILNKKVSLLECMNKNDAEIEVFQSALSSLIPFKLKSNFPALADESEQFNDFKQILSLSNPQFIDNPYPTFNYLRKHGSVHFIPADNAWLVLDHDDINNILKQPAIFSSKILSGFDYVLIGTDPPSHTLVRTMLQPSFSPRVFDELGHFASNEAHKLLKNLGTQPEFDFVGHFCLPMAQAVIAHFLGIDNEGALKLKSLMEEKGHTYHMSYLPEMEVFFSDYLTKKKNSISDDVGSLVCSFIDSGDLTFDQAVCLMRTLWIAGMTTTSMLLSSSVNLLLKNPEIANQLKNDEKLLSLFIEECLRLEPPESELTRITTQETNLGGITIPADAVVILSIRAANREPRYYPDPDELSLTRPSKRNLSFGGGYHYCLGIGMARTEAIHVIKAVLEEVPNLRTLKPEQPESYFSSPHFRGLETLLVSNIITD